MVVPRGRWRAATVSVGRVRWAGKHPGTPPKAEADNAVKVLVFRSADPARPSRRDSSFVSSRNSPRPCFNRFRHGRRKIPKIEN
jgi:hypothetical protein